MKMTCLTLTREFRLHYKFFNFFINHG